MGGTNTDENGNDNDNVGNNDDVGDDDDVVRCVCKCCVNQDHI